MHNFRWFLLLSFFSVVIDLDDINKDVFVISHSWLDEDENHACIPKFRGDKYVIAVLKHEKLPMDTTSRAVKHICTCSTYDAAMRVRQQYAYGDFPSSDGTVEMLFSETRVRRPKQWPSDEEIHWPSTSKRHSSQMSFSKRQRADDYEHRKESEKANHDMAQLSAEHQKILMLLQQHQTSMEVEARKNEDRFAYVLDIVQENSRSLAVLRNAITSLANSNPCAECKFPIKSIDDLIAVHGESAETIMQLKNIAKTTFGDSVSKFVRSLMSRLLTKELAGSINYSGAGGKFAFRNSFLDEFVIDEVVRNENLNCSSRKEASVAVRNWLQDCKENRRFTSPKSKKTSDPPVTSPPKVETHASKFVIDEATHKENLKISGRKKEAFTEEWKENRPSTSQKSKKASNSTGSSAPNVDMDASR